MALTDKLTAIGNAIREKTGGTALLTLDQMATEISNIQGGGTVEELTITSNGTYNPPTGIDGYAPVVVNVPQDGSPPESALHRTGDISNLFAGGQWNWFLDYYGKQMTMNDITSAIKCFADCDTLIKIPIDNINFNGDMIDLTSMFENCRRLRKVPKITIYSTYPPYLQNMFKGCHNLKELPYDFFTSMSDKWDKMNSQPYNGNKEYMFEKCYSLREHPDMTCLAQTTGKGLYKSVFSECYSLNEIINYPVAPGEITSNGFSYFADNCQRIKNMIFKTNGDGTPITATWSNQTIDLTRHVGYADDSFFILQFGSGITADKEVSDDATYQALKDDPDWFSCDINYSRYNHDSAVRTINSLPDTSAYLATAGGTNTIMFKGASGALTDGGAINTLTEEEIAVATAKGWTVSLV